MSDADNDDSVESRPTYRCIDVGLREFPLSDDDVTSNFGADGRSRHDREQAVGLLAHRHLYARKFGTAGCNATSVWKVLISSADVARTPCTHLIFAS